MQFLGLLCLGLALFGFSLAGGRSGNEAILLAAPGPLLAMLVVHRLHNRRVQDPS